jgi:1,2-dihydroxy-3-keto-5-methylthiopentene dioxygenase
VVSAVAKVSAAQGPRQDIGEFLRRIGVESLHRPVIGEPALSVLLGRNQLDPAEQERLLELVAPLVAAQRRQYAYAAQDLVVLAPETPGLDQLLAHFDQPHLHPDDEVRYILDGEGLFGFFDAEGYERVVRVRPGDYVRVPAGVEHRFTLTALRRIKALRLFTDPAGWRAQFTYRAVQPLALEPAVLPLALEP